MESLEELADRITERDEARADVLRLERRLAYALQALRDLGAEDVAERVENYESSSDTGASR